MCFDPITATAALFSAAGTGGAAAAGAAGAAAAGGAATAASAGFTFGQGLSLAGTAMSVLGSYQGVRASQAAADFNAAQIEAQSATERALTSVRDERLRADFRREFARQNLQLAARGVSLDSPTAVALGRDLGREMSFASQSLRSEGQAVQQELSAERYNVVLQNKGNRARGIASGASSILSGATKAFPGLADVSMFA